MTDLDGLGALISRSVPDLSHPPDRLSAVAERARRQRRRTRLIAVTSTLATIGAVTAVAFFPFTAGHGTATTAAASRPRTNAFDCAKREVTSLHPTTLPVGFTAAFAYRCSTRTSKDAQGNTWLVSVEERADSRLAQFVTALRAPAQSTSPIPNRGCALGFMTFSEIDSVVLTDRTGHVVRPAYPTTSDGCRYSPTSGVFAATRHLPWRIVQEIRVRLYESAEAHATGCAMGWKDMITWDQKGSFISPGVSKPVFAPRPVSVKFCVFAVKPSKDRYPVGTFTAGGTVPVANVAKLTALIEGAPAAKPCTLRHTRFAVVTVQPMNQDVYVELDGCHRLLTNRPETLLAPAPSIVGLLQAR
jgi:hypothetical protein